MDDKKRKKSGHEFRKDKRLKELHESAKACSKITSFYVKPNLGTKPKNNKSLIREIFPEDRNQSPDLIVSEKTKTNSDSKTEEISITEEAIIPTLSLESEPENEKSRTQEILPDVQSQRPNLTVSEKTEINSNSTIEEVSITEEAKIPKLSLESSFEHSPSHLILSPDSNNEEGIIPDKILESSFEQNCLSSQLLFVDESEKEVTLSEKQDYFKKPTENNLIDFFSYHPSRIAENELPFTEKKTIFSVKTNDGQSFSRQWLTYNVENKKLYCFICLAFSTGTSTFCSGFDEWRHVHQRIEQHEVSKTHMECVNIFMAHKNKKSTSDILFNSHEQKKKQDVLERRHVVCAIIDILKLIGKQGLAFRSSNEQAYTFLDQTLNHGNLIEMFILLSKYDPLLKKHLEKITKKSEELHKARDDKKKDKKQKTKGAGRGNFVTFLSNNTITKIIQIILEEMKRIVSASVRKAVSYSILMDTTIDVSGNDQCAFVIRYVKGDEVCEKLLALKCVSSTTGEGLLTSLNNTLSEANIPIENCVANAFDGASNMSGHYNGLTAKLSEIIPNHIHTWCYSHVLNLVLTDTAQELPSTISFFSLLHDTQVFIKESLKRRLKYESENPVYKLEAIGATRWRSRSNATVKIFGRIEDWTTQSLDAEPKYVFFELTVALFKISTSNDFNAKVRNEAASLLAKFLSFETIVTAMIFLEIFHITTPLSDYLQTKNLDYAQAWRQVDSSISRLQEVRKKFNNILSATKVFISKYEEKVRKSEDREILKKISISSEFKKVRPRKKKKMYSELCQDEKHTTSPENEFHCHIFNTVVDKVVITMENRFSKHKNFYLDIALFDPKRFSKNNFKNLPSTALNKICELIPAIDKGKLREEMISFASVWASISKESFYDEYDIESEVSSCTENEMDDTEESEFVPCYNTKNCNACIKCAFRVIVEYNMYSVQYLELHKVYKYLLTIPLTQVTCERVFSKLKLIKTRLRATMSHETLEAFIFMHTESDILNSIENDIIIQKLCETSSEMSRLLTF